jgi:hypothetical protein
MSNYNVRIGSQQNINTSLLGTVAPRKFTQLTDVNMIGVQNGDIVSYDEATKTFVPITRNNYIPDEPNLIYVAKNGNDNNSGKSIQEPKLTLEAAVGIASAGTVIRISPGNYTINNPLTLPDQVSLVGQSLREVSIGCSNPGDMFYIGNGNYIAEMSFVGSSNSGAIFSFDPVAVRYINQSPYIQNCTNFIPNSIGMRIDGKYAIGPIKSMVLDSYTQYNQGGIGISITNSGYAQLVSLFTICDNIAVYCGTGGACDLTNSNSSFGNYGLVADGLSPLQYVGVLTETSSINSDTFKIYFENPERNIVDAAYDNTTGILTAFTDVPHNFSVGMGVSLSGLGFTCTYEPGILTYPSGNKGYVFQTLTVGPGRYLDAYDSIQANKKEIQDKSLAAIAAEYPDFYYYGDTQSNSRSRYYDSYRLIIRNKSVIVDTAWSSAASTYPAISSTITKCKRDLGYFVDAVAMDVFTGGNRYVRQFVRQYFNNSGLPISNGLVGEEIQSVYAFNAARDLMKDAITNTLAGAIYTDLTLTPDPITGSNTNSNSCADVQSNIDTLVSIITTVISAGNLSSISSPDNYGTFNSGAVKCLRDIEYIIDAVSTDVRDYTSRNTIEATKAYFNSSGIILSPTLQSEIPQLITSFTTARDLMKLAMTNQLNTKNFSLIPDPLTNSNNSPESCADVSTFIDNLVGILTTRIGAGNINGINQLPSVSSPSTEFSVYVGTSTLPHTYNSGGTVKLNITRPFDGQVLYIDTLYSTVNRIKIINGGSGYTSRPTITIDSPSTSWGIGAQAVATVQNGSITSIDLISSGRGYSQIPKITISSPNVGINTAEASIEMLPSYYSVSSSTSISSGICTVSLNDNLPYVIESGAKVYFYKQSRILASGHSFEYIGSGTDITRALPAAGGVPIQENEADARNGGLVVYTSTDQSGNFRIGDGVIINQQTGNISGRSYSKSLFSSMTPYILALGGE